MPNKTCKHIMTYERETNTHRHKISNFLQVYIKVITDMIIMKNKNELLLREKDKIERKFYDEIMAQKLIQLAIRLQQKDIINHLGERIE